MDETPKHGTFPPDLIRLPGYILDFKREELRKENGEKCELRPQAFVVLKYLALNASRLVTKEELLAEVWRGMLVTDDSLVQAIGDVRRAINDGHHKVIKTVPRRGYMFIAENSTLPTNPSDEPDLLVAQKEENAKKLSSDSHSVKWRNWMAASFIGFAAVAGVLGLQQYDTQGRAQALQRGAVPDRPTLAVLPFKNLGHDAEGDVLGQGYADDLIIQLSRNADLRVISRYSSFSFKDRNVALQEIARNLGARYLVDGTVRQVENALRITIQVIDSENGRVVWGTRENTSAAQLLSTQDVLVRKIAGSVHATMRFDQENQALQRAPKVLDAFTLTLRAIAHKHQFTPTSIRAGRAELEQAIALDPTYAPAWVYLGYLNGIDSSARLTGEWTLLRVNEAIEQVHRGLSLDPSLAIAYQALSTMYSMTGHGPEALIAAQRAVELSPSDADNLLFLAKAQVEVGMIDDALKTVQESKSMYPIPPVYFQAFYARILWAAGRHADVLAQVNDCLKKVPRYLPCRTERVSALLESGAKSDAIDEAKTIMGYAPDLTANKFAEPFLSAPQLHARRLNVAMETGFPEARSK